MSFENLLNKQKSEIDSIEKRKWFDVPEEDIANGFYKTHEYTNYGSGYYVKLGDAIKLENMVAKHSKEIAEYIKTEEGLKEALIYYMKKHGCEVKKVIHALGYHSNIFRNNEFVRVWSLALADVIREREEKDENKGV